MLTSLEYDLEKLKELVRANGASALVGHEDELLIALNGWAPIPMLLWCPGCGERHLDRPEMKPHHTHACQHCGLTWRPALPHTTGVQFLPGFKDADK